MKVSAKELRCSFADALRTDTNTLLGISSRDRELRLLAQELNLSLQELRRQRLIYESGNQELRRAVTNISHDLRTPLTAVYGYLELLEKEETTPDGIQYIQIIKERTEMLTRLTEELFDYSALLSAETNPILTPLVLQEVLEESLAAAYTDLTQKGISPQIAMPEQPIIRSLDRASLLRIFSNLLSNAAKYSNGGLSVTLSEEGVLLFSNPAPRLDEVQVGRLFDRFYTVENARTSTGLGLSIARSLTNQMNGTIDATYKDGILTIRLSFPDT